MKSNAYFLFMLFSILSVLFRHSPIKRSYLAQRYLSRTLDSWCRCWKYANNFGLISSFLKKTAHRTPNHRISDTKCSYFFKFSWYTFVSLGWLYSGIPYRGPNPSNKLLAASALCWKRIKPLMPSDGGNRWYFDKKSASWILRKTNLSQIKNWSANSRLVGC